MTTKNLKMILIPSLACASALLVAIPAIVCMQPAKIKRNWSDTDGNQQLPIHETGNFSLPFVLNSELSAEERLSATVSFRYRDDAFTEISVVDNPYINGQEVSTIFHIVVDQDKLSTNNSKMVIDVHFTCYIEADHRTVWTDSVTGITLFMNKEAK